MSEVMLHPTSANCITCVPDFFIDNFMVEANGEYVKIYLYILRSLGRNDKEFSIANIADSLDHTQKDVRKALHYWERQGLLKLIYDDCDELSSIYLITPTDPTQEILPPTYVEEKPNLTPVTEPKKEQTSFVNEELKDLVYVAEKLVGAQLTGENIDQIMYWHDSLGLSWDLIEYIIEYSTERGSFSFRYMEKIALNFSKEGITTRDMAKQHNNAYLSVSFAVKSAFGITGRNLGQGEIDFVKKWVYEYGFSNEIIAEACKRALLNTHNASFEYADSILKSWKENKVETKEDLTALDDAHSKQAASNKKQKGASSKSHNFPERNDIDYNKLAKNLFNS